jgi:hypothetical protein
LNPVVKIAIILAVVCGVTLRFLWRRLAARRQAAPRRGRASIG